MWYFIKNDFFKDFIKNDGSPSFLILLLLLLLSF